MVSSVGILSIRGTRELGSKVPVEDPMAILQKGYSITIVLAVIAFGVVNLHHIFLVLCHLSYHNISFWNFMFIEDFVLAVNSVASLHRTSTFCVVKLCVMWIGGDYDSLCLRVDLQVLHRLQV